MEQSPYEQHLRVLRMKHWQCGKAKHYGIDPCAFVTLHTRTHGRVNTFVFLHGDTLQAVWLSDEPEKYAHKSYHKLDWEDVEPVTEQGYIYPVNSSESVMTTWVIQDICRKIHAGEPYDWNDSYRRCREHVTNLNHQNQQNDHA